MHVHPDIAARRGDKLAQRRIRKAMIDAKLAWQGNPSVKCISQDLERYAKGRALDACPSLHSIIFDRTEAMRTVSAWIEPILAALRDHPLGEAPHLYRCSPGLASVQLLTAGRAALNVVAYERRAEPRTPVSAVFADREATEMVLSGIASVTYHRLEGETGPVETSDMHWKPGMRIEMCGARHARQVVAVESTLLLLQLTREPDEPRATREFRLSDGALLQTVSGNKAASQRVMALAVLGAMGHGPALDAMGERALDREEDPDVRWEAVRQSLSLDPIAGVRLLGRLKREATEPLAKAASALEAQLMSRPP